MRSQSNYKKGIAIVCSIYDDMMYEYVDCMQLGSRSEWYTDPEAYVFL